MNRLARLVWRVWHRHQWSPWVRDDSGAWRICVDCLQLDEQ